MSLVETEETIDLVVASHIDSIAEVASVASGLIIRAGFSSDDLFGLELAIREAVANAIMHGNKQDETKRVDVTFKVSPSALEVKIRDRGEGFDPTNVPDPTDPKNLMRTSGRGLLFMRTFMDHVEWTGLPDGGTLVNMVKRR
jgi:serine/threonine-protein kinase RsbW